MIAEKKITAKEVVNAPVAPEYKYTFSEAILDKKYYLYNKVDNVILACISQDDDMSYGITLKYSESEFIQESYAIPNSLISRNIREERWELFSKEALSGYIRKSLLPGLK
jgi:hypothetical protein